MSNSESFDGVLERLRAGDDDAAAEIFSRYANRLILLARSRLQGPIRQKVDPEDVTQSVFRSFFVRQAEGQFQLDDWDSLWSLLVRITLRKCGKRTRQLYAGIRDARRETSSIRTNDQSRCVYEAIAREPTPQEAASLTETLEQLVQRLEDTQQQMIVLRLQGYTVKEISREVGRTERSVHRVLAKVRDTLLSLA
jgi:RNA polymerase sigma-70 factor (ECF subfamily)